MAADEVNECANMLITTNRLISDVHLLVLSVKRLIVNFNTAFSEMF